MNNVGTLIGTDAPFLPDYFHANSAGLAAGYLIICSTISGLIGSSFVPFLGSKLSDIRWIFYGLGAITLVFAFILSCGLKDVERVKHTEKEAIVYQEIDQTLVTPENDT